MFRIPGSSQWMIQNSGKLWECFPFLAHIPGEDPRFWKILGMWRHSRLLSQWSIQASRKVWECERIPNWDIPELWLFLVDLGMGMENIGFRNVPELRNSQRDEQLLPLEWGIFPLFQGSFRIPKPIGARGGVFPWKPRNCVDPWNSGNLAAHPQHFPASLSFLSQVLLPGAFPALRNSWNLGQSSKFPGIPAPGPFLSEKSGKKKNRGKNEGKLWKIPAGIMERAGKKREFFSGRKGGIESMRIPGKGISIGNHILGKQQEELLARSWNSRDFSFFSWDSNGEAGQEGEFKEQHPTWKKNFGRPPQNSTNFLELGMLRGAKFGIRRSRKAGRCCG